MQTVVNLATIRAFNDEYVRFLTLFTWEDTSLVKNTQIFDSKLFEEGNVLVAKDMTNVNVTVLDASKDIFD